MARLALGLAGAAVGNFFLPGIGGSIGFGLGSALGSFLTRPDPPTIEGPKIEDGTVTSSAYGIAIPKIWGTTVVAGNIIDVGPLITEEQTSGGGKGFGEPEPETTTYTQYKDYDVLLCDSASEILKVWINETLFMDNTSDSIVQSPEWFNYVFYDGAETQEPDPTFEALRGSGNVPAYRGVCHVVFRRLKVSEFGTTALNFKFLISNNISASNASTVFLQDDGSYAYSITRNPFSDLMIGTINKDVDLTPPAQMLVAINPYTEQEVYRTFISDSDSYSKAGTIQNCAFFVPDANGFPVYQPAEFVAVLHEGENTINPNSLFIRFFFATTGVEFGFVQIQDSATRHFIEAPYLDQTIFYHQTSFGGTVTTYRYTVDSLLNLATLTLPLPIGYDWYTSPIMRTTKVQRLLGEPSYVLAIVENQSSGDLGVVAWTDTDTGPAYSTPDDFPSAITSVVDIDWDENNDAWWVLHGGSNIVISKVTRQGTIESTTDWNTEFSISGGTSGDSMSIDTGRDNLWVVKAGGIAYKWPTYDITETPIGFATGIDGNANVWNPATGTLWTGSITLPQYTVWHLNQLAGGGVTLQSVNEAIIDAPGAELLTGDRNCTALSGITVQGFAVHNQTQRRAALDTLRRTYLYDLPPRNGVLTAILRGQASSDTLNDDSLGAHILGQRTPPRLSITGSAESALPRKVGITFVDPEQNYEAGYEPATRQASAGGTEQELRLAVVLTHDEASELAHTLIHAYHVEAESYKAFVMPSKRSSAIPAAVLTATVDDITYPMLINESNIVDGGILEVKAVRYDASIYTAFSVGGTTRDRARSIPNVGSTLMIILDLPAVREADLDAGLYAAVLSYNDAWGGAQIYDSADNVTYSPATSASSASVVGTLTEAYTPAATVGFDAASSLKVQLIGGSLSSSTFDALMNDATSNYAAIGSSGNWQIIKFQTVSQGADDVWTISDIFPGQRDTISVVGPFPIGAKFVLLNAGSIRRIPVSNASIGVQRYYKAVTTGQQIVTTAFQPFTAAGSGLKPFKPIKTHAEQSGSDWDLSWQRQDRAFVRMWQDAPMSETSESYEIEILDAAENVVNTYTATSETYSYTSAQQSADFGGTIDYIKAQINQQSSVVGDGKRASISVGRIDDLDATITGRGTLIEYWACDDASTPVTSDSGSHDLNEFGTIVYNSDSLTYDGSSSVKVNATGARFFEPYWAGLANVISVEFFIKFDTLPTTDQAPIINHLDPGTSDEGWWIGVNTSGNLVFIGRTASSTSITVTASTALATDTPYHVVVNFGEAVSDTIEIYVDGIIDGSGTVSSAWTYDSTNEFNIMHDFWSGSTDELLAWISKIAFYDTKLTNAEIYTDSIAGFGP